MSKMDKIAELVFDIARDAPDDMLGELDAAMQEMAKNGATLARCKKQPAFAKLWDALAEAVDLRSQECCEAGR
jgi:septation ring formation regulator EzrA